MPAGTKKSPALNRNNLRKCPTGIRGLDEVTEGGLPEYRTTLVCGGAGSGKTLLGIDFLINGAINYHEPGIFMSFEESEDELYKDVASLNLDLQGLVSRKKIQLIHVVLEHRDIQENDFNLEGLLIRLEHAIDSIGAKRVVLDSIESLFAGVTDNGILRLEVKGSSGGSRINKSQQSLPVSQVRILILGMDSRNTSPTASFFSITASKSKCLFAGFA